MATTGGLVSALSGTNDKNNKTNLKPEYIAPLVLLLSMDQLDSGRHQQAPFLRVGCGWHAQTRLQEQADWCLKASML